LNLCTLKIRGEQFVGFVLGTYIFPVRYLKKCFYLFIFKEEPAAWLAASGLSGAFRVRITASCILLRSIQ